MIRTWIQDTSPLTTELSSYLTAAFLYVGAAECTPEEPICDLGSVLITACDGSSVLVIDIYPNFGISGEVITISGTGFSDQNCNNIIKFGGKQ